MKLRLTRNFIYVTVAWAMCACVTVDYESPASKTVEHKSVDHTGLAKAPRKVQKKSTSLGEGVLVLEISKDSSLDLIDASFFGLLSSATKKQGIIRIKKATLRDGVFKVGFLSFKERVATIKNGFVVMKLPALSDDERYVLSTYQPFRSSTVSIPLSCKNAENFVFRLKSDDVIFLGHHHLYNYKMSVFGKATWQHRWDMDIESAQKYLDKNFSELAPALTEQPVEKAMTTSGLATCRDRRYDG